MFAHRDAWIGALLLAAAAAPVLSGCASAQGYLNYPFVTVEYKKHGVVVSDINHKFEFDALGNTETIKVGRSLTLVDHECDGRVDLVESGRDEYQRGETGTEALFEKADAKWRTVRAFLLAGRFRSKRAGMLREEPGRMVRGLE